MIVLRKFYLEKSSPGGANGKEPTLYCQRLKRHGFVDWEDPLEKGMATHSRILAWRSLWTEEPGGQKSIGSQLNMTEALSTFIGKKFSK